MDATAVMHVHVLVRVHTHMYVQAVFALELLSGAIKFCHTCLAGELDRMKCPRNVLWSVFKPNVAFMMCHSGCNVVICTIYCLLN